MSRTVFDDLYVNLEREIEKFQNVFIKEYIRENQNPRGFVNLYIDVITPDEEINIKVNSYVVAVHALFERFFEEIARKMIEESRNFYDTNHKVNIFLQNLILLNQDRDKIIEIDKGLWKKTIKSAVKQIINQDSTDFESYFREVLDKLDETFTQTVESNHVLLNIYNLLVNLGIDKTGDRILYNHMKHLAKERGDFAHQGITTGLSPANAQMYIDNVLKVAQDVVNQINQKIHTI